MKSEDREWLIKHSACAEAIEFVEAEGGCRQAWEKCRYAPWMLWALRRLDRPAGEGERLFEALRVWGAAFDANADAYANTYADARGNSSYAYAYAYAIAYAVGVYAYAYAYTAYTKAKIAMCDVIRATVPNPWVAQVAQESRRDKTQESRQGKAAGDDGEAK